jgi:hypothetical protein
MTNFNDLEQSIITLKDIDTKKNIYAQEKGEIFEEAFKLLEPDYNEEVVAEQEAIALDYADNLTSIRNNIANISDISSRTWN